MLIKGLSRYFLVIFVFKHMLIDLKEGLSRYFTTCFQKKGDMTSVNL